jgi:RNA polymerase sigma factor (sigma-70 family)
MKCEECHQQTYNGRPLCYYHQKIKDGLIDPPEIIVEEVDTTYEELMARKWDHIVIGAARSWGNQTMLEELLSTGREGLLMAIRTWNQSKGMQNTYFSRCVKNAMINVMSKQETFEKYHTRLEDQAPEQEEDTLEELTWEDVTVANDLNPEELIIRREEIEEAKIILTNVIGALNERENFVLDHRILERNMGLQEIADKFGVSHMAIKRDEARIKKTILVYTSTSKQEQERKTILVYTSTSKQEQERKN